MKNPKQKLIYSILGLKCLTNIYSRCLMKVYYQVSPDIDRYVGLIDECTKYHQQNIDVGMLGMIVFGAFMHGMEPLILRIAEMLHMKVFMDLERREFLDRMLDNEIQAEDSVHYRLRERVVDNPRKAHIHILDVDNINETVSQSNRSQLIQLIKEEFN